LGIKLRNKSDAATAAITMRGYKADGRNVYLRKCQFKFNPYALPSIPGYNLLLATGINHPITNPSGVTIDHMLSVEYGWRNGVDPLIISHPANCQYMSVQDNSRKNTTSSISLLDLIHRIESNNLEEVTNTTIRLPKSEATKKKISDANKRLMKITNGVVDSTIDKDTEIPQGYRRGITRGLLK
jgi:hypothetical protein